MSAIVEAVSPSRDALPVCLWREKPNRLVSLWEMRFEAVRAIKVLESLAKLEMTSLLGRDIPSPTFYETCASICEDLVPILRDLGLVRQAVTTSELASFMRSHETLPDSDRLSKLSLLIHHDLDGFVFEAIPKSRAEYYENPLKEWGLIVDRFACSWDVEEAGKCFAFGRWTACVFHLMRTVECAVLELQCFLDKPDPKAHFGSVLAKVDSLNTKTQFQDLPARLKPYRNFLIDITAPLYALKLSWRDKVSHVDGKIIPAETFTEDMALGVYNATLILMGKLATGMPSKSAIAGTI